tara:strand:- start:9222 stop:9350 length:129 start_codon:yes stop_codon:yes gene_type:complete
MHMQERNGMKGLILAVLFQPLPLSSDTLILTIGRKVEGTFCG